MAAFVDLAFGLRREERERWQGGRLPRPRRFATGQDRRVAMPAPAYHLGRARRLGANAAEDGCRDWRMPVDLRRLLRLLSFHRRGHRWRLDFRRHAALLRVLGNHFATLLLTSPLFTPFAKRFEQTKASALACPEHHAEESPERELRRDDDRQKDQREDDDGGPGAIQVVRHLAGQPAADVAARPKWFARDRDCPEEETQKGAGAGEGAPPVVFVPAASISRHQK